MKQILYSALVAIMMFAVAACTNDDINVTRTTQIKVSTTELYNSLGASDYQTYLGNNSNCGIAVKLLIYGQDGKLVKEADQQVKTLSSITIDVNDLTPGDYTVVALQTIKNNSDELDDNDLSFFWTLSDKNELSKVHVDKKQYRTLWLAALGLDIKKLSVSENGSSLSVTPQSVGYLVHFEYEKFYNTNYVEAALFNHNAASGLYIDPSRTGNDKFYQEGYNEQNTWSYIGYILESGGLKDSDSADFFVIETGANKVCIGVSDPTQEKNGKFTAIPSNGVNINFEIGKSYTVYCIYNEAQSTFEYYFGESEGFGTWYKNHQNSSTTYFAKPVTNWGTTVSNVKNFMSAYKCGNSTGNAELNEAGYYVLWYYGKYAESDVDYYFKKSTGDLFRSYIFLEKNAIDNETLTAYIENMGYSYVGTFEDDTTKRFVSEDGNTAVETGVNADDVWYICFFNPNDDANKAPARSIKRQAKRHR